MAEVSDNDLRALITTWEKNPNLLGFRDAVLSCLTELQARRAAEAKAVEVLKWYVDQSDEGGWIICDSKGRKLTTYRDLMMRGRAALGARDD